LGWFVSAVGLGISLMRDVWRFGMRKEVHVWLGRLIVSRKK
jgi:hypothetical protein